MHQVDQTTEQMVQVSWRTRRTGCEWIPSHSTREPSPADLYKVLNGVIRDSGRSPDEVLGIYSSVIAPASSPRTALASSASFPQLQPRPACCSTC